MAKEAQSLSDLFARQAELSATQTAVAQELILVNQKILYLLAGRSRSAVEDIVATPIDAPARSRGSAAGRKIPKAKKSGRHSWFERGEVLGLLKKAAKVAVRPADAVRAVLAAKGIDRRSKQDQKLAAASIYQAISASVKAGRLSRDKAGRVVAR